jgi:hypothetical protein
MGTVVLLMSMSGLPLVLFLLRRLGRWGGVAVEAGCGALSVRDVTMVATGAPARLCPVTRLLFFVEIGRSGTATLLGAREWVWRPLVSGPAREVRGHGAPDRCVARRYCRLAPAPPATGAAHVAAAVTFVVHTEREASCLRPGHGRLTRS